MARSDGRRNWNVSPLAGGTTVSARFGNGSVPSPVLMPAGASGNTRFARFGRALNETGASSSLKTQKLVKSSDLSVAFVPPVRVKPVNVAPRAARGMRSSARRFCASHHSRWLMYATFTENGLPSASTNSAVSVVGGVSFVLAE